MNEENIFRSGNALHWQATNTGSILTESQVCQKHTPLGKTNKKTNKNVRLKLFGTPKGNRTPDSAVRGRHLDRLTMGALILELLYYTIKILI